jgi:hypothetical protein
MTDKTDFASLATLQINAKTGQPSIDINYEVWNEMKADYDLAQMCRHWRMDLEGIAQIITTYTLLEMAGLKTENEDELAGDWPGNNVTH